MTTAGDASFVGVAESATPTKYIDNEKATNATTPSGFAERQRVADPDSQQLLSDLATIARIILSNIPARDGSLDASRVTLAGTANAIATVTTVTTVTTVSSVTNQTSAGGYNMGPGQIAMMNAQAAALRSKISVTP